MCTYIKFKIMQSKTIYLEYIRINPRINNGTVN